ncbi:hypothetical protein ACHAQA_005034 [Verticillium albo-atrum]
MMCMPEVAIPVLHDGRPSSVFEYGDPVLPLDGTHIRLLRLRSSRGDTPNRRFASPLHCSLVHSPLENPLPFKALSYTWGTGKRTHWIDIGGSALTITASLDTALRHIRSDDQDVIIWIDQICINQDDVIEKTSQVQLMREIYSKADQVIVWLGPPTDRSDELMDCWQEIGQAALDLNIQSYYTREGLPVLQSMMNNLSPQDEIGRQFKALVDRASSRFKPLFQATIALHRRPWFHRVWVVQEAALCPDTVFQCGLKTVPFDLVSPAYEVFDASMIRLTGKIPDGETLKIMHAAQNRSSGPIVGSRRRSQRYRVGGDGYGDELFHLLRRFFVGRGTEATHSRDRIYGLLGLAADAKSLGIVADYIDDDPRPSFVATAKALIRAGRVEVLSYSQFPKEKGLESLPTWVPDWRPMLARSFYHIHEHVEDHRFAAAGDTTVGLISTEAESVLGIRGYIVDTIEEVTATWRSIDDFGALLSNMQDGQRLFDLAQAKDDPIYNDPKRRAEALWRFSICDTYPTADHGRCRPHSEVETVYHRHISLLEAIVGIETAGPEEAMASLAKLRRFEETASVYRTALYDTLTKKPFVTEKGFLASSRTMAADSSLPKFMGLIDDVDNVPLDFDFTTLFKLLLPQDDRPHGFMIPATVSRLPWTADFIIDHERHTVQVKDAPRGEDPSSWCNRAFQTVVDAIVADVSAFTSVHGRHSEPFRVMGADYPVSIERFPAPLFGIGSRGAHMTGYVKTATGLKIWVPRRSRHLFTYPGMLDTTVAGGVKAADEPFDCIVAEAGEEASLPTDYVKKHAKAVGAVTYVHKNETKGAVYPTVLYVYDLEMPESMVPKPMDDEVEEFLLMTVEEVTEAMLRSEFKSNCVPVMLDFYVRHGILTAENSEEYLDILTRLRRPLPVATNPGPVASR